jgi:hypothetical protein
MPIHYDTIDSWDEEPEDKYHLPLEEEDALFDPDEFYGSDDYYDEDDWGEE